MIHTSKVVSLPAREPPDVQRLRDAALGDREAFAELIRSQETMMYRIALSMLRRDADCADAVQEAIFKAWRGISKVRDPEWMRSWLIRILINECNQILRRRKRFGEMPPREPVAPPRASDDEIDVLRALESLSEAQRVPVVLYYYEDFSVEMIAHALGLPQGTVKSRLYAARQQLKRLLEVDET